MLSHPTAHRILHHAYVAIGVESSIDCVHLGGPKPTLPGETIPRLVYWLGGLGRDLVPEKHRDLHDERMCFVAAVARDEPGIWDSPQLVEPVPKRAGLELSRMAMVALQNIYRGRASYAIDSLVGMVRRIAAKVDDPVQFLAELDQQILCCEAEAAVNRYADTPVRVVRVLYREPGAKPSRVFVVEHERGFGALVKLKRRYRFVLGDREEVFATLPDEHLMWAAEQLRGAGGES